MIGVLKSSYDALERATEVAKSNPALLLLAGVGLAASCAGIECLDRGLDVNMFPDVVAGASVVGGIAVAGAGAIGLNS